MKTNKITGIILGGGKSMRMQGFPKGLIKYRNIPFIEIICDKLNKCCNQIIISTNTTDYNYLPYPCVKDKYENKGPLGGIFSSMLQSDNELNLIIPCDMPFVDMDILNLLIKESSNHAAVAPFIESQKYFMPCIIKNNSLTYIEKMILENKLKLGMLLNDIQCQYFFWDNGAKDPFHTYNINSIEELQKLELHG